MQSTDYVPSRPVDGQYFDTTPEGEPTWVVVLGTDSIEGGFRVEGLTTDEWLIREFITD